MVPAADLVSALTAISEARSGESDGRFTALFDLYAARIHAFQVTPNPRMERACRSCGPNRPSDDTAPRIQQACILPADVQTM